MDAPTENKRWDAEGYDRRFGFVSAYGAEVLKLLAPQPGERVLDLGCGTGELTGQIRDLGAEVVGLDQDPGMIRRARERHPGIRFDQADGHRLSTAVDAGSFDAVFSNAALHWMLRPADVIAGVRTVLRPGGRFVAETGGQGNVGRVERALHQARADLGAPAGSSPWFFPSIATYSRLLEDGGLEPRSLSLHDRWTPLAEGPPGLQDWLTMFATPLLADLDPERRALVLARTVELVRPALFQGGRWAVDYRRLRFLAVRA